MPWYLTYDDIQFAYRWFNVERDAQNMSERECGSLECNQIQQRNIRPWHEVYTI